MRITSFDEDEPPPHPTAELNAAAEWGKLDELRALLAGGMPVDPPRGHDSAFQVAVMNEEFEAAKLLLAAGAKIDHAGNGMMTPLAEACRGGKLRVVQFLLQSGASLTAHDNIFGWTIDGAKKEVREILALLVRSGIDPNIQNWGDTSILMAVCRCGDIETARLLIDRGADVNERLKGTPLTCAEENGHQALVDLLLERGAKTERADLLPDAERDALFAAASEQPSDPSRRLAWADWLSRHGFLAAAAAEREAARVFDAPWIEGWRFARSEPSPAEVTRAIVDPRVPGARVTNGTVTYPLVIVAGGPCTSCDENGDTTCSECNGTGIGYDYLADKDFECSKVQECLCKRLKYRVWCAKKFGAGPCKHPKTSAEFTIGKHTMLRCSDCGLAGFHAYSVEWACGVCGYFVCRCFSAESR